MCTCSSSLLKCLMCNCPALISNAFPTPVLSRSLFFFSSSSSLFITLNPTSRLPLRNACILCPFLSVVCMCECHSVAFNLVFKWNSHFENGYTSLYHWNAIVSICSFCRCVFQLQSKISNENISNMGALGTFLDFSFVHRRRIKKKAGNNTKIQALAILFLFHIEYSWNALHSLRHHLLMTFFSVSSLMHSESISIQMPLLGLLWLIKSTHFFSSLVYLFFFSSLLHILLRCTN